jgi:hypothetical protein
MHISAQPGVEARTMETNGDEMYHYITLQECLLKHYHLYTLDVVMKVSLYGIE